MSGTTIAAQITGCQNEIMCCEQKASKLKMLIEDQENEHYSFIRKKTTFEDCLCQKKQKKTSINNIVGEMTIADKYIAYMDSIFEKENAQSEKLEYIDEKMSKELTENRALLYTLENELYTLQNRLSYLNTEHHLALHREAEESARAAQAAQSKNTIK